MNPADLTLCLRCSTYAGALVLAVLAAAAVLTCIARGATQHTTFEEEPDLSNEATFGAETDLSSGESSTDSLSEGIESSLPEVEVIPEPTPSYANV